MASWYSVGHFFLWLISKYIIFYLDLFLFQWNVLWNVKMEEVVIVRGNISHVDVHQIILAPTANINVTISFSYLISTCIFPSWKFAATFFGISCIQSLMYFCCTRMCHIISPNNKHFQFDLIFNYHFNLKFWILFVRGCGMFMDGAINP
jgi:hypothetical protein